MVPFALVGFVLIFFGFTVPADAVDNSGDSVQWVFWIIGAIFVIFPAGIILTTQLFYGAVNGGE